MCSPLFSGCFPPYSNLCALAKDVLPGQTALIGPKDYKNLFSEKKEGGQVVSRSISTRQVISSACRLKRSTNNNSSARLSQSRTTTRRQRRPHGTAAAGSSVSLKGKRPHQKVNTPTNNPNRSKSNVTVHKAAKPAQQSPHPGPSQHGQHNPPNGNEPESFDETPQSFNEFCVWLLLCCGLCNDKKKKSNKTKGKSKSKQ